MKLFFGELWQANIEFSLLLAVILMLRFAVRKLTKSYNVYLIWSIIPAAFMCALAMSFITISAPQPPVVATVLVVQNFLLEPVQSLDYWRSLIFSWGIIAFLCLFRLLGQHWLLRRDLASVLVSKTHRLHSEYPIVLVNKVGFSPGVYGFFKPKIYFPQMVLPELTVEQVRLIIQHEEQHIRQCHLWLNLLWDISVCLLWFNPLVYFARQGFRHDQELFCDYLVLKKSSEADQESYGLALLSTVSATQSLSLLCSWKAFNQLEERIMNMQRRSSKAAKFLLLICGIGIVGASSLYAANQSEKGATLRSFSVEIGSVFQPSDSAQLLLEGMAPQNISCGFIRDDTGPISIVENDQCTVFINGSRRDLTGNEKAAYLTYLKQTSAESKSALNPPAKFEFEMNEQGNFDEQAFVDAHKSQGYPDELITEIMDNAKMSLLKSLQKPVSFERQNEPPQMILLGLDNQYYATFDGEKRSATEAEIDFYTKNLTKQGLQPLHEIKAESTKTAGYKPQEGDSVVSTRCIFYGIEDGLYDECKEKKKA